MPQGNWYKTAYKGKRIVPNLGTFLTMNALLDEKKKKIQTKNPNKIKIGAVFSSVLFGQWP